MKYPKGLVCVDPTQLHNVTQYGVDHYVFKIPWNTVEPSSGVYSWTAIDNALNAYGPGMTLRIQAGGDAPGWLKTLTGTISVYNPPSGNTVNVCHWWETIPLTHWANMMAAAGARYDHDPRVVLVSADEAMTVFSEPFIIGDNPSGAALFAAGCTQTTQGNAITQSVHDTCVAFPNTRVEFTIHSNWQIPVSGGLNSSWPLGRALALSLGQTWGQQLVISDYGLSDTDTLTSHTPSGTLTTESDEYAWMLLRSQALPASGGGPVGFQLTIRGSTPTKTQYANAAQNAYDLGGWYVEHSGWGTLANLCPQYDGQLKTLADSEANVVTGISGPTSHGAVKVSTSSTITSDPFSPAAGSLIIVPISVTGPTLAEVISSCTSSFSIIGSWTILQAQWGSANQVGVALCWAIASGSPGTGTVTVTFGGTPTDARMLPPDEFTGQDGTTPVTGSVSDATGTTSTTPALNVSTAPTVNDFIYGVFASHARLQALTVGSGYTLSNESHPGATPAATIMSEWRTGSTATDCTAGNMGPTNNAAAAIIIKAGSTAPTFNVNQVDPAGVTDVAVVTPNFTSSNLIGLTDTFNLQLNQGYSANVRHGTDAIIAELASEGFTTGSILDRERARLLATNSLTYLTGAHFTLNDLYRLAGERPRLY